jgi:hypothetical protein
LSGNRQNKLNFQIGAGNLREYITPAGTHNNAITMGAGVESAVAIEDLKFLIVTKRQTHREVGTQS